MDYNKPYVNIWKRARNVAYTAIAIGLTNFAISQCSGDNADTKYKSIEHETIQTDSIKTIDTLLIK